MKATIKLGTADQAGYIATMPQLIANGHHPEVDGTSVILTTDALDLLSELDEDIDGYYDGEYVWIGGIGYRVVRHTGRPTIDANSPTSNVSVRLTAATLQQLDMHAFTKGTRSEQIRRAVEEHLQGARVAQDIQATDDPREIISQIREAQSYVNHVRNAINRIAHSSHADPGLAAFDRPIEDGDVDLIDPDGCLESEAWERIKADTEFGLVEMAAEMAEDALRRLYVALDRVGAPYARQAEEAAIAAIPHDV